jgi:polysaccharide biosynthesis/export protein
MTAMAVAGLILALWPAGLRARQQFLAPNRAGKRSSAKAAQPPGSASRPGYRIAPADLLSVYVVGVPELSRSYRVSPAGRITLPMLDHPVAALGLTPDELSEAIGDALRRHGLISRPDVLVSVVSSPLNSIAITGAVARPGVYSVFVPTNIVAILSRAGGLSPDAGSEAIVVRGAQAMRLRDTSGVLYNASQFDRTVKIPIRHLLDTGDERQNLLLYPCDEVDVLPAGIVYVVGAVNRAGGFALTGEQNELTVLQAIALAGNVTRTAMLKRAVIIRRNPRPVTGRQHIPVDLKKILSGKIPDLSLNAGDILFVPDSTGKHVLARALAAATSVVIYRAPL